jgi:hypothetical protein
VALLSAQRENAQETAHELVKLRAQVQVEEEAFVEFPGRTEFSKVPAVFHLLDP